MPYGAGMIRYFENVIVTLQRAPTCPRRFARHPAAGFWPARIVGRTRCVGLAVVTILSSVTSALGAAQITISGVERLQPGWIRVYLVPSQEPAGAHYKLSVQCAAPTQPDSLAMSTHRGKHLAIDVRANLAWLNKNSQPQPCHITRLTIEMLQGPIVIANAVASVDAAVDLPLSHITPANTPLTFSQTSIPLTPSTYYAAYPPLIVGIQSATGSIAFAEVEELVHRGTLGLRGLSTFSGNNLVFELGGGGEMPSGWGLDVNELGIWRAPQLPVEISNPDHESFPYSSSVQPPILLRDPTLKIYPAPPLFSEADYQSYVLHNRGIARCQLPTGCMDIVYDRGTHEIKAVNGAKIALAAPSPISGLSFPQSSVLITRADMPVLEQKAKTLNRPTLSSRVLSRAREIAAENARDLEALASMRIALDASAVRTAPGSSRDYAKVPPGPQELAVKRPFSAQRSDAKEIIAPKGSCVINPARTGVTRTPSRCQGMSHLGFACPTPADPIEIEAITETTSHAALVNGALPPYYAGRNNYYGSCGSHATTQYIEMLLARYSADLAVKRLIYVNGDPILVPEPRVALSVTAAIAQLYTWDGTQRGDPPDKWPSPRVRAAYPSFPEAYWTAREGNFVRWATAVVDREPTCASNGFWHSGFCVGQGRPGIGVYRSHSLQVQNLNRNPLEDGAWSLANSYFNFIRNRISLTDRDRAIQDTMQKIREGLPVKLAFDSTSNAQIPDGSGQNLTFVGESTWFLPPELGGCDRITLDLTFHPSVGHELNIIGYQVFGDPSTPDIFNSYFILQNNWGKNAGYRSFYFMNFAAFKFLATELIVMRLDRSCWSVACAQRPIKIVPRLLLKPLLYPPDPSGPTQPRYQEVMREVFPLLGGMPRQMASP
jgi:hypothetical protein